MYAIKWRKSAKNDLAELWLASNDRNAVSQAASEIEKALSLYPLSKGESRQSSVNRILYFPPLYVEYDVVVDDEKVIIQAVGSSVV